MASIAPAAPRQWPVAPLVEETGVANAFLAESELQNARLRRIAERVEVPCALTCRPRRARCRRRKCHRHRARRIRPLGSGSVTWSRRRRRRSRVARRRSRATGARDRASRTTTPAASPMTKPSRPSRTGGSPLSIVVALRERSHRTEPRDSDVGHGRLSAAAQHDLRTTEAESRRVRRRSPCSRRRKRAFGGEWALRSELHRNPGCSHVRDDLDDRERGRAIRASIDERRTQSSNAVRPPIPVAMAAPTRSGSRLMSIPLSASAMRAAERANCENTSMRLACFRSIQVVGS